MDEIRIKLDSNSVKYVVQEIYKLLTGQKVFEILIREWSEKRTISANAQQHVWYRQIGNFYGLDPKEAGNMCKLDFGLPILLGDERYGPQVNFVLEKIGFWDFNREQQINAMDLIAVTSLFKTKQHNEYRDNLQLHWSKLGLVLDYQKDKKIRK